MRDILKLILFIPAVFTFWSAGSVTCSAVTLDSLPLNLDETQGFYKKPLDDQSVYFFSETLQDITFTFSRSTWLNTIKSIILTGESMILEKFREPTLRAASQHMFKMDALMLELLIEEGVGEEVLINRYEHCYNYYQQWVAHFCGMGHLSWYAIAPAELAERLDQLQVELRDRNLELSFPHQQNISVYYEHQNVQCTINPEEIVVKLGVPLKRMDNHYSMERVTLVPFLKADDVCVADVGEIPGGNEFTIISRNNKERFLLSPLGGFSCVKSLCMVLPGVKSSSYPCLNAILYPQQHGNNESMLEHCFPQSSCHGNQARIPFVYSAAEFTLIITTRSDVNISCHFQGKEHLHWTVKPPKLGTIKIVNPCSNCAVTTGLNTSLLRHSPNAGLCDPEMILKELQVSNVIPSAMEKLIEILKIEPHKSEPVRTEL